MAITLDYNSLTTGILKFLRANSTTIDSGLYASVTFIDEFRPEEFNVHGRQFPAISVDLVDHEEERLELGELPRRKVICNWEVGCHVRNIASYTAVYQAMRTFVTNVETAFRSDDRLSSTFEQADVTSASFGNVIDGKKGGFQKNGLINLTTISHITNE